MLSVERIQSSDKFFQMRSEWNDLLQRSSSRCVFLSHEWLSTWWKHLAEDRKLNILAVREGDQLVGLLPVSIRRPQYSRMMPQVLEFIGSGLIGSDYLDAIIDPQHENDVLEILAHHLTTTGLMLQCSQLRRGDSLAARLAERLERRNWVFTDVKINVCPYIPLAGHTWESYLATLSSSQRYNFQRRVRNLEKLEGYRFETKTDLDVLIELHNKRWDSRGGLSEAFQTPEIVAFHREFVELAADRGWLRLLSIWVKDQPAAALYGLHYGSTFYFYQSGFDSAFSKQSVGLVMMGLAIRTAVEGGASEYDLLHGEEEYKFHWARETRELGRIEAFPPHVRGAFYKRCVTFNRAARQMVRRMLIRA